MLYHSTPPPPKKETLVIFSRIFNILTKYNFFKKISFISKYINTIPEKNIKKGWKCQFLILYAFRVYVTIEIRTNAIFFLFQAKLKVLEHYKQKKLNE